MYAVIRTSGKQFPVRVGEKLRIDTLEGNAGDVVHFPEVLFLSDDKHTKIGAPLVEGSKVTAEIIAHGRADKVKIIKFRRRKHHLKRMGHRQNYTEVKITAIQ